MEPITVKSKLDLKTYYRITFSIVYGVNAFIAMAVVFIILNGFFFWVDNGFRWINAMVAIAVIVFCYGIFLPFFIWLGGKRNRKKLPVLNETVVYNINNEHVEGIMESSSDKIAWKYIIKAIEKEDYFLLLGPSQLFRYLPKSGFVSGDIEKFKEIVKANNIKAYFK